MQHLIKAFAIWGLIVTIGLAVLGARLVWVQVDNASTLQPLAMMFQAESGGDVVAKKRH